METLAKIVVLFAGLSILAAVGFLIYLVWDEWQHRKKSKRLEREWREAMAELCAAAGIDPDEPEPVLTDETFRSMLRNITPETLREANKAVMFFGNQLDGEEDNKLSAEAKGVFMAALLLEYGKLTANKKEHGRAADPEEKQQGIP